MFESAQHVPVRHSTNELIYLRSILQAQAPLVSIKEINELRQLVTKASLGECFLMQLGDCAERSYEFDKHTISAKLDFIQHLAAFFHKKTGYDVVQIGRIRGQYEYRDNSYESHPNNKIHSYFEGIINQFQEKHLVSNFHKMLLNYQCVASIYQEINQWNWEIESKQKIHTSHEILLPSYEQTLTRQDKKTGLYYNLATHFLSLSERTINSIQHINYLKKIANPIAVKIGPDTSIKHLIKTINELDPDYLPGRITLIPRLGAHYVHRMLPQLIEAVKKTQRTVLWSCDPMYGNTEITNSGIKIRTLSHIIDEIKSSFLIHKKMGSKLNAIHLEATHQDVTECVDYESAFNNSVKEVKNNYKNQLDPRLNYEQTVHVIQFVAHCCVECL